MTGAGSGVADADLPLPFADAALAFDEAAIAPRRAAIAARLGTAAQAHEEDLVAPLSERERTQLAALLDKLRDAHGLDPLVHPGYRS